MPTPPTSPSAWRFLRQFSRGLTELIYPSLCHLCDRPLSEPETGFCTTCRTALTTDVRELCPRCAATIGPFSSTPDGCVRCRDERFRFAQVIRLGKYDASHREAVLRIKQQVHEGLAEALGQLLAESHREVLTALGVEVIVPMPLHWLRRWQRGYNQAEAIALGLASALGIPCRSGWLWRRRNNPRQTLLSPTERRHNLKQAFAARSPQLRGKHFLLVDDVLTTGTTANEAARALLDAGAAKVFVAVIARGEGA